MSKDKRKATIKRFSELDQKVGRFTALTREFTNALYREMQLVDLATDYLTFVRTICLEQALPSDLETKRKELEKQAEELGISENE